jgi:hypothetical protein
MDRPSANLLIGDSPRPLAMRLALVCAAVAATTAVIDPLAEDGAASGAQHAAMRVEAVR